ncbi:hypothetical protein SY88_15265 [Clostridiales bacterium PH28_bin88]|nr:hypothetical protein SY88_15265 [Clostridiales bacterium PH28_bin88]
MPQLIDGQSTAGWLELPLGTTVQDACQKLGIDLTEVLLIDINGQKVDLGTTLSDGDTLGFFPMISGG